MSNTIVAFALSGDDLVGVQVRRSAMGARWRRLAGSAPARATLVLVLPGGVASVRPFSVRTREWEEAREGVQEAVETLFPLESEDALLGVVDRGLERGGVDEAGEASGPASWLVAASRRRVKQFADRVAARVGREPDVVLAPVQAALGLGLRDEERAAVVEGSAGGYATAHHLRRGRLEWAAEPWSAGEAEEGVTTVALPGAASVGRVDREVEPEGLALAGALAASGGSRVMAPLSGAMRPSARRWAAPVGLATAAAVLAWAGMQALPTRVERELAALEAEREAMAADVERVSAVRREALALHRLVTEGLVEPRWEWRAMMPTVADAHALLGRDAWLYRMRVDFDSLVVEGEARRPDERLRAIEASERFSSARFTAPPRQRVGAGTEIFEVSATREVGR